MKTFQGEFNSDIGELDRILSVVVNYGRMYKGGNGVIDKPNAQTLKHHAEDMIAAGQKILRDLGAEVEGTPQPDGPQG